MVIFGITPSQSGERLWQPAADVYRTSDGWIVKFDLAGVSLEDIEVSLSGCHLRVRGVRRDTLLREGYSYYQLELAYSRFERAITFPCLIDSSDIVSEYRDGLLILRLTCRS